MKKLLFTLLVLLFIVACDNNPITVNNPEEETTMEIINIASTDTICYKVVEIDNTIYILNNNLVVKKVNNLTGFVKETAIFMLIIGLLLGTAIGLKINS